MAWIPTSRRLVGLAVSAAVAGIAGWFVAHYFGLALGLLGVGTLSRVPQQG